MTTNSHTINVSLKQLIEIRGSPLTLDQLKRENEQLKSSYFEKVKVCQMFRGQWEEKASECEKMYLRYTALEKEKRIIEAKLRLMEESKLEEINSNEKTKVVTPKQEKIEAKEEPEDDTILEFFGFESDEQPQFVSGSCSSPIFPKTPIANKKELKKSVATKKKQDLGQEIVTLKDKKSFLERFEEIVNNEKNDIKVCSVEFGSAQNVFYVSYNSVLENILEGLKQQRKLIFIESRPAVKIKKLFELFCSDNVDIQNILLSTKETQVIIKRKMYQDFINCIETLQNQKKIFHLDCHFQLSLTNPSYLLILGCD